MRVTPAKRATLNPSALTELGSLTETFVVGELRKQISWLDEPVTNGHWRGCASCAMRSVRAWLPASS